MYSLPLIALGVSVFCFSGCKKREKPEAVPSIIQTAHLDHLYEEIQMGDDTIGIIHIYSEYPGYQWVGDADEGIACVDDASRAAIFYLQQYQMTQADPFLHKGKMLMKFIQAMQAPNGYYYNFIHANGTINTDGMTSLPEPNFWSWRSLWALGVAIDVFGNLDDPSVARMKLQREKLIQRILNEPSFSGQSMDTTMGLPFPTWLPKESGTDQAAIVIMALVKRNMQEEEPRLLDSITSLIRHFADGIISMQVHAPDSLQDGAFRSWENLWHAYANIQAFALLIAGEALQDSAMTQAALYEIDHFYPMVLKAGGLDYFGLKKERGRIFRYETKSFHQIAYGRRPMIWAALEAHALFGQSNKKYLDLASQLAMWFFGENPAHEWMYDPQTGRGYDGINSPTDINRNAGAESTIEALLSLQAMEMHGLYFDLKSNQFIHRLHPE